jgi:hypothetical protein
MKGNRMNKTNLTPEKLKQAKLLTWNKFKALKIFKLGKNSKAAVVVDKTGAPKIFLLDTFALLDVLSAIDEALVDKLSTAEYNAKSVNPAGWLIDEIEAKLPLNPAFVSSLEKAIEESKRKGWIPFSKVKSNLGLS